MAIGKLTPSEMKSLKAVLSPVAYEFLNSGNYPKVATLGAGFLSAGQRQLLTRFAENPSSVTGNQLTQFTKESIDSQSVVDVFGTIVYNRRTAAEESARTAPTPSKDREPNVPLPAGQIYSWDSNRKLWTVVGSPGSGKAQQLIRYVNQYGETVDETGKRIQQPSTGFGPEGGTLAAGAEAERAAIEAGAGVPASTVDAVDQAALAQAEFGLPPTMTEPYAAPAGYEWVYDPLQSKPVLQKIGEDGATTTVDTDGDGGGGVSGGVTDVSEEPADSNIPEDWREAAREMYPQYYAIVRNIPEIAQLLEKAINESYTPQKFQAELEQTNWWLQTSGSAREWQINSERDPASAQRKIDEQIVVVRDLAQSSFGVRLSDERLTQLATDSLRFGWSNRFLQNAIGDVATTSTTGISQLREGYIGQQLRKTANDYGISVSDATFNKWVNSVAVGQESTATFQDYAKVQAKNLFPSISDRIDAGETFQDIIDPYRESAASLLEIDGGTIDFKQPDWIKAVTYMDDKGEQRPMSFTEWNDYVRQNRSFGYEYTEQAQRRAYQVANSLANLFGKV